MANVPDYRGMFLRGYGSQSHAKNNGLDVGDTVTNHASCSIGQIQGDAIRPLNFGLSMRIAENENSIYNAGSADAQSIQYYTRPTDEAGWHALVTKPKTYGWASTTMRAAYHTPVANEIRPANIAVRYLIRSR